MSRLEFALVTLALGAASLSLVVTLIGRHVQHLAARYAHELRAALAAACIALEVSEGLAEGEGLTYEQRTRLALGEMRRGIGLMRSLEETATRSLRGQMADRLRELGAVLRRRRLEREGSFDPREETLALVHVWRAMARPTDRIVRLEWHADDRQVLGRRDHFVQALSNLLGNALRHGAGEILVRAESDSDRLRVSVTDQGGGLPAPLARLTRRRSRARHGHGLPVSAWAVKRLGGTLRSAPASLGARLVIELPLARPLLGDGSSDWYTEARAGLKDDAGRREARVIPFRRPGAVDQSQRRGARGSRR
jgi:signal transduction histidine kinase